MKKAQITLRELSAKLKLSPATVSLVLSGQGKAYRIAPETRLRVEEAARRLDYRPNHLARSMRLGRSDTLGVVFPDICETYMNRVLSGIESMCRLRDVSMIIATSSLDPKTEARNLRTLIDKRVDGLLLLPYAPFDWEDYSIEPLSMACNSNVPIVAVDRHIPGLTPYAVVGADQAAASRATGCLVEAGCRRLAYLGFNLRISSLNERRRGFQDRAETALKDGKISDIQEFLVNERNPESRDISDWVATLCAEHKLPDGFLVSTDGLALKLRAILGDHQTAAATGGQHRNNPLIARFGEDSPYFSTGMISVRQPHEEIGRLAAEKLLQLIAGETPDVKIHALDMEVVL